MRMSERIAIAREEMKSKTITGSIMRTINTGCKISINQAHNASELTLNTVARGYVAAEPYAEKFAEIAHEVTETAHAAQTWLDKQNDQYNLNHPQKA